MSKFRYFVILLFGVFILLSVVVIGISLFFALLPIILPVVLILILLALLSGKKRCGTCEQREQTPPQDTPASQDTIDIKAIEISDNKGDHV